MMIWKRGKHITSWKYLISGALPFRTQFKQFSLMPIREPIYGNGGIRQKRHLRMYREGVDQSLLINEFPIWSLERLEAFSDRRLFPP